MASPLRHQPPATYEDLRRVPEHRVAEILGGDLHVSPRPAAPHAIASSALGVEVGAAYQFGRGGPGGWWILDEPELHFADDVLVPDLAGWRRQRMPEKPTGAYFTLAPDWVCEVVSPATERLDRVFKLPVYAREGVGHAWLVNPLARTLEVYRLESVAWRLVGTYGDDAVVRAEPFEAVELDLLHLWGETRCEDGSQKA
jgi:Uma2 family endonuclease